MELADAISEEYLTCVICLELFKHPKQLPCLHTFCKKCLSDHIESNVGRSGILSFPCPVCRKVSKPADPDPRKLHEWVDCYPDNFFVIGLMDTLKARQSESRKRDLDGVRPVAADDSEQCSKHPDNTLEAYCTEHKVGVCERCIESDHTDCRDKHLGVDDAGNIAGSRLKEFKSKMENLRSDVDTVREKFTGKPRCLKLQKEEVSLKISQHFSTLKNKVIRHLLQQETQVMEKLKDVIHKEETSISESVDECDSLLSSFDGTVSLFEKLMTSSPINALFALDSMADQIENYSEAVQELKSSSEKPGIKFVPLTSDVEDMLQGLHIGDIEMEKDVVGLTLGNQDVDEEPSTSHSAPSAPPLPSTSEADLRVAVSQNSFRQARDSTGLPQQRHSVPNFRFSDGGATGGYHFPSVSSPSAVPQYYTTGTGLLASNSFSPPRILQEKPRENLDFNISRFMAFSGNLTHQERRGGFVGIAAVSKDLCTIVDRFNRNMKLVNIHAGRVVNAVDFGSHEPWDVTNTGKKQLAVTCPKDAVVYFVSVDDFKIKSSTNTKIGYSSITAMKGELFAVGICSPFGKPSVEIINSYCQPVSFIDGTFAYPRCLETTADGKLVICDWTRNEVVIVGDSGRVEKPYHGVNGDELKNPKGIATDSSDNIFVLDHKAHKLHVVSGNTGKCCGVLPLEGISEPRMVACVPASHRYCGRGKALVVLDGTNGVHIFSVDGFVTDTQV